MHKRTAEERENAIQALGMSWADNFQGTAFSVSDFDSMLVSHFRLVWHTEQYHNNPEYYVHRKIHDKNERLQIITLTALAQKYSCTFHVGKDGFTNWIERDGRKYFFPISEEKD